MLRSEPAFSSLVIAALAGALSAQEPTPKAATVAEAARVLDLATFPLMPGGTSGGPRRLAELNGRAKGTTREVYAFQKKTLESRGWKELPGGYLADDTASGAFAKDGFTVSVSAHPSYGDENKGHVDLFLKNHGNVDLKKLPVPPDSKLLYSFPAITSYVTGKPVEETAAAMRKLLTVQGWEPYGTAGDSQNFKKNAVLLSARVLSAPGQGGKTVIDLASEQLSADLPAPAGMIRAAYDDSNKALSFDSDAKAEDVVASYRDRLGKDGWKPTTDRPIKDRFKEFLIFRNPSGDLLELNTHEIEGKLRGTLEHRTAAEVAELDRLAKLAAEKRKKPAAPPRPKVVVAIAVPAGREVKEEDGNLAFQVAAGQAKATVEAMRAALLKDGWKEEVASLDKLGGVVSLKKGRADLTIHYIDTGIMPAEVTASGIGAEVEAKKGK